MCSAVCPLAFCALTSSALLAVALSSILISGRWPFCAEMCNAVLPLLTFCRAAPPSAPSQQAARVWGGISSWQERHGRTCLAMAVGSTLIIAATSSSLFLHRRPFAEHHAQHLRLSGWGSRCSRSLIARKRYNAPVHAPPPHGRNPGAHVPFTPPSPRCMWVFFAERGWSAHHRMAPCSLSILTEPATPVPAMDDTSAQPRGEPRVRPVLGVGLTACRDL
jgi:hypothetical protein